MNNYIFEGDPIRLDNYLLSQVDKTRSAIKNLIEKNKVLVNGKVVKAGYLLKTGDNISIEIEEPQPCDILPENIPLNIVYQDDDLAVINKPQGMVVHPSSGCYSKTLVNALLYNIKDLSGINGEIRPGIVHRLDKNTSGLIVIAKNDKAHVSLAKQIQDKTCARIYRAILVGRLTKTEGTITTCIARGKNERKKMFVVREGEGKIAITDYKVLQQFNKFAYVEFSLKTGRTHQIRVHSAYIGHPVVGDPVYGKEVEGLNGQLLHAYKIKFVHPTTNQPMEFSCPLPDYFENFLSKLS